MHKPLLAFFLFGFLVALPASSQVSSAPARIKVVQYSVTVDQPAYAGEPMWVHTEPTGKVHYPFRTGIGDFGCNRLELMHDGKMLSPRKLKIWGDASGILCGWVAPPNAPMDRLPLHVWFPSLQPGQYAVRWISEVPDFSKGRPQMFDIASDWTTFVIEAPPAGQHEEWLGNLLAHVPPDPGMLAGDYIPNLAAAAPNTRALHAIAVQLYSDNQVVAELAASALQVFPQDDVTALLTRLFHAQGPSDVLARVVCADSFRKHRAGLVADSIRVLSSDDNGRTAAAIEALNFLTHNPNDQTPDSAELAAAADTAVLQTAPRLISSGNSEVTRQLAVYLGSLKSPEAHKLLWQIASASGDSAEQAQIALTWNPVPEDLPHLAALLLRPGDADLTGRDLASIPYSLMRAYGDRAVPWLEKAVTDSPYLWVCVQSAVELARRNDSVAFRFILDAIESHRFYSAELIRDLKESFPTELDRNADDAAVIAFLKQRLAPK